MAIPVQLVLRALLEEPAQEKYERQICAATGLPGGIIHPVLALLKDLGWLDSREQASPRRCYYRLTPEAVERPSKCNGRPGQPPPATCMGAPIAVRLGPADRESSGRGRCGGRSRVQRGRSRRVAGRRPGPALIAEIVPCMSGSWCTRRPLRLAVAMEDQFFAASHAWRAGDWDAGQRRGIRMWCIRSGTQCEKGEGIRWSALSWSPPPLVAARRKGLAPETGQPLRRRTRRSITAQAQCPSIRRS
jgi:PadR family transcriptional regulator, regulatory protein PadR